MNLKIKIIKGDITTLSVDAVVNAANSSLMGGGGVDGAIHKAAGPQLKEACRLLKGCLTGDAKITPGFLLQAKYVIHTVGPVWNNGTQGEEQLLTSAYRRSLEVALENNLKTVAFPSISTGAYRFPFNIATEIALRTMEEFLAQCPQIEQITFVAFSQSDYEQMLHVAKTLERS